VWAGAGIAAALALAALFALRGQDPAMAAVGAPAPAATSRGPLVPVIAAVPAPPSTSSSAAAPVPPVARESARPSEDPSPEENELRALEDEALRQIDVVPILRAAGIDVQALQARPDGNDLMRHVAADELLTRSMMRDRFANTIYPHGYPRDQIMDDARGMSNRMVAALSREARIALLQTALADGSSAEPEPTFYGPDSGRVFAEGDAGDSAPQ